jgi:hypothetical protein
MRSRNTASTTQNGGRWFGWDESAHVSFLNDEGAN